jgi:hypothetical protein
MCAKQVCRNFLITLLLLVFVGTPSHLSAATRGIKVVAQDGHPLYLYKDYHAVVIAVSDYDHWPKLPNAVRDAEEVAGKLKELGFQVKLVANPDSQQLKSTLSEIARRLGTEKNRALLLYYAGHGETTTLADGTELGYVIPKDCPLQNLDPLGFDSKAVSMKEIEMLALRVKSKHMLALFDSCFSGSLFALSRAAPADISEKSAKPVRQFITAGGSEESVPDRSIFKVCLLRGLDGEADYNGDGYVTGSELGMYLQTEVVNYTRGAQHPQYGKINNPYLDRGDFIFVSRASGAKTGSASLKYRNQHLAPGREKLNKDRDKLELAAIPKTVTEVSLRNESKSLTGGHIRGMLLKYDFFERDWNPRGSFSNYFIDNGDRTITDRATRLTWQKSGSGKSISMSNAAVYIRSLNQERFAGYSDWRLPSLEELASLLKRETKNRLHIDPMFDNLQKQCWSADSGFEDKYRREVFAVNFEEGKVVSVFTSLWGKHTPSALHAVKDLNYVRAVRSNK